MRNFVFAAACAIAAFAQAAPARGVAEAFEGRLWKTEERVSMLKFMGANGMGAYIYAPHGDPYAKAKWREPYPAAEMAEFAIVLGVARENGIAFHWAARLGDVSESSQKEDYAALTNKLEKMYAGGFRAFALFFDGDGHRNPAVHAKLCNRVQREFLAKREDCAPLVVCPYASHGAGKGEGRSYRVSMGKKLDGAIRILWTGRNRRGALRQKDVDTVAGEFRREPFVMWNWPANDYCRSRLLLGPADGMQVGNIAGFAVVPMENCEASKIGVACVAQWLRDPSGYDAQKAWEKAVNSLCPDGEVARAMGTFAKHNADPGGGTFSFNRPESADAEELCETARDELRGGALARTTHAKLESLFKEVRDAAKLLLAKLPQGRFALRREIEGWLEDERLLMEAGLKGLALLGAKGRDADRLVAEIRENRAESERNGERHRAKCAAATNAEDAKKAVPPEASARVLAPAVERILHAGLDRLYETRAGRRLQGRDGRSPSLDELLDALKTL